MYGMVCMYVCVCTRSCDGELSTSVCSWYMYNSVHHHLILQFAGSLSTYVDSCVLLFMVVDRCSISIKQRGVLYIYSLCSSKHLTLVLCRYMSLFVRVCVMLVGEIYIFIFDTS